MQHMLKEPLFHFFVAGVALFVAYAWLVPAPERARARTVHITEQDVAWLKESWARQWQRQPDGQELRGLVSDYLKEQLLAREARELGLDENDTVVRRRLAQKMEFLVQDTAQSAEPDDAELRRFHEANAGRFQAPARISLTQVYFTGPVAEERAADAMDGLKSWVTAVAPELGDRTLLAREILREDESGVAAVFGAEFAKQVFALEPGAWRGPIRSAFGLHLVRVSERQPAQSRAFDEVRDKVLVEWQRERQQAADREYFSQLLKKYDVVVDESVKPLVGPLSIAQNAKAAE